MTVGRPGGTKTGKIDAMPTESKPAGNGSGRGRSSARRASARDRDADGRARNARPRDALGRPLPYGAPDVARQPEGTVRTPQETLTQAQSLLDHGLPFHAHEVFEDAWKSSTGADRAMWKGMAQWAVGLTHLLRDNRRGAVTLLIRGRNAIAAFDPNPYGIDIDGLVAWASALVTTLETSTDDADITWVAPVLRS